MTLIIDFVLGISRFFIIVMKTAIMADFTHVILNINNFDLVNKHLSVQ